MCTALEFKEVKEEIARIEDTQLEHFHDFDKFRIEADFNKKLSDAKVDAMFKKLDDMQLSYNNQNIIINEHMNEESGHHLEVSKHMAATNEILKSLATKSELEKEKGRVNTISKIISLVFIAITAVISYFVWTGFESKINSSNKKIKSFITTSSKKNYNGIKKIIINKEKNVGSNK